MTLPPDTSITDVPDLGPVTALWLAEIEVTSFGALVELGAVETYARLRFAHGRRVTRNALHAMDAAIQGIPWRALPKARKDELDAAAAQRLAVTPDRPDA